MNARTPATELPLDDDCRRALEAWVCEDPSTSGAADHIRTCSSCRDLAEAIRLDQDLLRWQLGRIETPEAPRLLLREPLRAASGHPRRVSLAVIPFLLGVSLVLLLGVLAMLGGLGGRGTMQRQAVEELDRLQPIVSQNAAAIDAPGTLWSDRISAIAPGSLTGFRSLEGRGPLDPYGEPYRVRRAAEGWRVYSSGPNRLDENGGGDDLEAGD